MIPVWYILYVGSSYITHFFCIINFVYLISWSIQSFIVMTVFLQLVTVYSIFVLIYIAVKRRGVILEQNVSIFSGTEILKTTQKN